MPKLERLEWLTPLSEGRGVTLSDDPQADLFLAENPGALLLGVLYDSQFATRRAFAAPLHLQERLGYLDMQRLAAAGPDEVLAAFRQFPALHRFPAKYAGLTQQFAQAVTDRYGGDASRIWREAVSADDLADRLLGLPAFGAEKTDWTMGMLGILGMLPFDGWEGYRSKPKARGKRVTPRAGDGV
jgi:uncharacterized HhH-GPD family protein